MRYITVPAPIEIFNLSTGESTGRKISFHDFTQGTLLIDKRFGKSMKELQAALRIGRATREHDTGVIALETTDWEVLRDTAKEPSSEYLPGIAVQLLAFIEAIVDAPDTASKNGASEHAAHPPASPAASCPVDGTAIPVVA